jgi:hypothetical protein
MHSQPGFWVFSFEDCDLLSEREDLQREIASGPEKGSAGGKQGEEEGDHETTVVTLFNTGIQNLTIRPQVIDLAQRLRSGNTQCPASCDLDVRFIDPP